MSVKRYSLFTLFLCPDSPLLFNHQVYTTHFTLKSKKSWLHEYCKLAKRHLAKYYKVQYGRFLVLSLLPYSMKSNVRDFILSFCLVPWKSNFYDWWWNWWSKYIWRNQSQASIWPSIRSQDQLNITILTSLEQL